MASGTVPLPRLRNTPQEPGLLAGIMASETKSSWAEWGAGEAPPTPRENRVTQDCERTFPELKSEAAGQRSIDAVDLENEVHLGTLLSLLSAVGCWVWVDDFLEQ